MRAPRRLDIPPHVAARILTLPPEVKESLKEALRLLARDPAAGEPLRRDLEGYWTYRVRRYRIVYEPAPRSVRIIAVGHRRTIYEEMSERLRRD